MKKHKLNCKIGDYFTYKFKNETYCNDQRGKITDIVFGVDERPYLEYKLAWKWNAPIFGIVGSETVSYLTPYDVFSKKAILTGGSHNLSIPKECDCDLIGEAHCKFHDGNFKGIKYSPWILKLKDFFKN